MDKIEHIFNLMKEEVARSWHKGTIEDFNVEEVKETSQLQLQVMVSLQALYQHQKGLQGKNKDCPNVLITTEEPLLSAGIELEELYVVDTQEVLDESVITSDQNSIYEFQRNLRGGILPAINGFVPEGVVRKLELRHGDMVEAKRSTTYQNEKNTHYDYRLVKRQDVVDERKRLQYNLCPVEDAGGIKIVRNSNEQGLIKANGEIIQLVISERDVEEFKIELGDVVDIAFFESDPTFARVIWRHHVPEMSPTKNETKMQTKPKAVEKKVEGKKAENKTDNVLEGKTVCVVGESHNKSHYEFAVRSQGGRLVMADGKQRDLVIRNKVSQSDIVMCVINNCSHAGMESSRDEAKKANKPFVPVHTSSAKSLVSLAITELEKIAVSS